MKKIVLSLFVALLLVTPAVFAGTYTSDNKVVHLQGDTSVGQTLWLESQVKIRFDHLKLGWDHNGKVDRLRYHISCHDGKAVLQNVEYVDAAIDGYEEVRWVQADENMNKDFSFIKDNRDRRRDNTIKHSVHLNIEPSSVKTAKVKFHIYAKGRHYIVIWEPKSNRLTTTWERIR